MNTVLISSLQVARRRTENSIFFFEMCTVAIAQHAFKFYENMGDLFVCLPPWRLSRRLIFVRSRRSARALCATSRPDLKSPAAVLGISRIPCPARASLVGSEGKRAHPISFLD